MQPGRLRFKLSFNKKILLLRVALPKSLDFGMFMERYLKLGARLLGFTVFAICAMIFLNNCERDPDPAERELLTYLTACPVTVSQCQSNCSVSSDTSGNGIIEGIEAQIYNVCVQNCQYGCYQVFLFYLLTDEGN